MRIALLCLLLSGCSTASIYADYTHLSAIPDSIDLNTTDQLGLTLEVPLHPGRYAPSIELSASYELGDPVYGRNPVGTFKFKQPLWRGK